jgi:hypothetical protein
MSVKCYLLVALEPPRMRLWLRRYTSSSPCPAMPGTFSYHNARSAPIGDVDAHYKIDEHGHRTINHAAAKPLPEDPRWPARCSCGYAFTDAEDRQLFSQTLYRRADTGEVFTLADAPIGAIYNAWWFTRIPAYTGPDGQSLMCRCPDGHDWMIDGRASNCTLPDDNVHKCWVRHGTPPELTVDKNGVTCSAGAGSIATGKWHGFLRNGYLVGC